mmetsp:Transcript_9646/g.14948  ORF Transcript_9646/g.14948 Transcript_9646/m.14948 type:complete len:222 (+) Transcript_9646:101-766(+)|eukprot:CAMPEP_0118702394 /NCGR_PEP_ID=MMETSP0800-20121206/17867_1 /TAXON_ID=210618 ORGANISM="Striatella unipunctata, Strain CCMP2910" /NCGR_SAMPLE_ID=MMETSP0800 /ASSEMBLY_ACC=CAM_ASM_000638 /LENGTH=221 /DNA_ID=CAMNT_0006603591 /DNA_START=81 /DNA_END=746 /DNA_ORIENTATION=+
MIRDDNFNNNSSPSDKRGKNAVFSPGAAAPAERPRQKRFSKFSSLLNPGRRDVSPVPRRHHHRPPPSTVKQQQQQEQGKIQDEFASDDETECSDLDPLVMTSSDLSLLIATTAATRRKNAKPPRNVSFSCCDVREYNVVVGDSPSCKKGLPIALGWDHTEQVTHELDRYEMMRASFRAECCQDMYLDEDERMERLMVVGGYSLETLNRLEKLVRLEEEMNA